MNINFNFFRNPGFQEPDFFDEGPKLTVRVLSGSGTGSIDTSLIDQYRQGIELTQMKHYDAGIAKIHAGEPGHMLRKNNFGEDRSMLRTVGFGDLDLFDPVRFLRAQEVASYFDESILTFPIITGDSDQFESFNSNGIIEPLTIRAVAGFFSTDAPFESHSIKGSFMGGNEDQFRASSQVVVIEKFDPRPETIEYLDDVDMLGTMGVSTGFFRNEKVYLKPFKDERSQDLIDNIDVLSQGVVAALSLMTGSTDNYISSKERSHTAGWDYDNTTTVGTDSIAFGGMTY